VESKDQPLGHCKGSFYGFRLATGAKGNCTRVGRGSEEAPSPLQTETLMFFNQLDVSWPVIRLVALIAFIATLGLYEADAEASTLAIRATDSTGSRIISAGYQAPQEALERPAAQPATLTPQGTEDAAIEMMLEADMRDELRTWLLQQEQVDKSLFASASQEDTILDRVGAEDPFAATQAPVALRAESAEPAPVIRAVLADPIPMFHGRGPAPSLSQVSMVSASNCAWPLPCHGTSRRVGTSRQPSERSRQYARSTRLNYFSFSHEIQVAAARFGVDPLFIRAVMHAESSFNPSARSHAGAQGLMQLMPATARRFGVQNAFEAAQNIRGGSQYLAWLINRFNGNMSLAAAAYNAGEGAVDRHGGIPPYRETIDYVEKVITLWDRYRSEIPDLGTAGAH